MPKAKKGLKRIPKFESEAEERRFWATADATDYVDWRGARRVKLPNLHPTTRTISIRLPETMIEQLKVLANKRDVPYQSLLKLYVAEKLADELRSSN